MVNTTVSGNDAARSLKVRVEVAQTPVSRLGTMLRTFFFPANAFSDTSLRLPLVSLNAGAAAPGAGRDPHV